MVSHYFPGDPITALPFEVSYDSTVHDSETENEINAPGGTQLSGGNGTAFSITGTGAEVDFYAVGDSRGLVMELIRVGETGTYNGYPLATNVAAYSQASYSGDYPKSVGIRHLLVDGGTYYLWIGSYSTTGFIGTPGQPGWVSGFGQQITLIVDLPPVKNNNLRDDALDVVIWGDGQTYTSVPVLNAAMTHSNSGGTDDPALNYYTHTAWWCYVPETAGDFTAAGYMDPEGFPYAGLSAWRMDGSGTMTLIDESDTNPGEVTGHADANEVIYFVMGLRGLGGATDPGQRYQLTVTGKKSTVQLPDPVDPIDPDDNGTPKPTPTVVDHFNPTAVVPAKSKTCVTVLDLIRAFSAAIRRPVRITGASTIEVVDPNEPLPTGWVNGLSSRYYSRVTQDLAASARVLSLRAGDLDLSVSAGAVANDVGLVSSGWRIPQRLPVPDLNPAPVKRVSLSFTPTSFRASVEFQYPAVPLKVTRT